MTTERDGSFRTPGGSFDAPNPGKLSLMLDGYDVNELIACGGMGAVYRARQMALEREVAIKVLPTQLSQFEEFKKGFHTEARAMAKLNHPNLLGVHDFGEVEEMLYLVMEYVDGASLFEAEHGEAVEALQAVRIAAGVADGLGHAHKHGILHRDIKPANILITCDLEPKLGDFGLAVPTGDVESGLKMGTPGYMAPEVVRDFRRAAPASDVYSLGVILHEMLTGVTPTADAPPKLEIIPRLRGLVVLVQKATAREPYMRYGDGEEMAEALHKWLAEAEKIPPHVFTADQVAESPRQPVHAGPAPLRSARRAGSPAVVVGVIAAVLLCGALVLGSRGCGGKTEDPPIARRFDPDPADKPIFSPKPDFDVDGHQDEMREELGRALDDHIEAKQGNFRQFGALSGESEAWTAYFGLADQLRGRLPRFLGDDHEIVIDQKMADLLNEFAIKEQDELDEQHREKMRRVYDQSKRLMSKEAPGKMPPGAADNLIGWLEWLGVDLLEIFDFDPAGVWKSWPTPQGGPVITITIRNDGARATILEGGLEEAGLVTPESGGLTVIRASDQRTWRLSLRPPHFDCLDEKGELLAKFERRPYSFTANEEAEKPEPMEPVPPEPWTRFEDPELSERNQAFYSALERELGALRSELLVERLEEEAKKAETGGDVARAGEIHGAIKQAMELDWEKLLLDSGELERIEVPPDFRSIKREFDQRMRAALKSPKIAGFEVAWVQKLKAFKAEWATAGKDTADVDSELQRWAHLAGNEQEPPDDVPSDARGFRGNRYKIFVTEKISFEEAREVCEGLGGHLAMFADREEQEFIADMQQGGTLWIGGSDSEDEGRFLWLDGTPVVFGKLNGLVGGNAAGRDFLHLTRGGTIACRPESGFLSSGANRWVYGYVCEWGN